MTRRHLRRLDVLANNVPARQATTAHMLRTLADRVERGEVRANFHVAFVPEGEMWMLSALILDEQEEKVDRRCITMPLPEGELK